MLSFRLIMATFACTACLVLGAEPVTIEVASFEGGYGIDFFLEAARQYEKLHPDVKVNLHGHPRISEQLVPRFAMGNVPDLCWPGMGINTWELIFGGQLLPMNKYLEQPAYGTSSKKWIDTYVPSLLNKGKHNGNYYVLPYNFDTFGWWYDKTLFDKHGWKPPRTERELLALCEEIKKAGIAPVTFTGRYPDYLIRGAYLPWSISAGGLEPFYDAQDLVPGAWKNPAFLRAAKTIVEMKKRGNFQAGCIGMSHTESQMEFLGHRAAMIPCGTWLHSEMKKMLPPGFDMRFMLPPVYEDGKGDPSYVYAGPDNRGWCIPTKAKHPDIAADFMRFMSSPEMARQFIEKKGTLMSIKTEGEVNAAPHLKDALEFVRVAKSTFYPDSYDWYPLLATAHNDALRDLFNEMISAEEFVQILEDNNEAIRKDPQVVKLKVQR